ncbi:MAG: prepilin-type N-terminal cleavage/methylation domain-containing protein [Clostridia bacterium]|nr:prepilin-type N-terminal cleavage/methylation domain-containing protein [Clostridia bacterium]
MHSKNRFCSNDHGFSLVELIVVIAIMAILAAVAIPTFAHFITMAKEASDIAFRNDLEHAIILVHADDDAEEISGVIVTLNNTNGSIKKIEYQVTFVKTEELADNESAYIHTEVRPITADEAKILSEIMDFDYKFKAIDSINDDGRMNNKNWNAQGEVKIEEADDRWDERVD